MSLPQVESYQQFFDALPELLKNHLQDIVDEQYAQGRLDFEPRVKLRLTAPGAISPATEDELEQTRALKKTLLSDAVEVMVSLTAQAAPWRWTLGELPRLSESGSLLYQGQEYYLKMPLQPAPGLYLMQEKRTYRAVLRTRHQRPIYFTKTFIKNTKQLGPRVSFSARAAPKQRLEWLDFMAVLQGDTLASERVNDISQLLDHALNISNHIAKTHKTKDPKTDLTTDAILAFAREHLLKLDLGERGAKQWQRHCGRFTQQSSGQQSYLKPSDFKAIPKVLKQLKEGRQKADDPWDLAQLQVRRMADLLELGLNQWAAALTRKLDKLYEAQKESTRKTTTQWSAADLQSLLLSANGAVEETSRLFTTRLQRAVFFDPNNSKHINPLCEWIAPEIAGGMAQKNLVTNLATSQHQLKRSSLARRVVLRDAMGRKIGYDSKPRQLHPSHYGRLCPLDTPISDEIGTTLSLTSSARIDEQGFIQARYYKVDNRVIKPKPVYLGPWDEADLPAGQGIALPDQTQALSDNTDVIAHRGATVPQRMSAAQIAYIHPEARDLFSPIANLLPYVSHNRPSRSTMACSFLRQTLPLIDPQTPRVLAGREPAESEFQFGTHLRVGYMIWYGYNFEDALVISQSAADALAHCDEHGVIRPAQLGDKLANRHGHKGVIGRILADHDMPYCKLKPAQSATHCRCGETDPHTHLQLLINPLSVISRQNLGQLRETVEARSSLFDDLPERVTCFDPTRVDSRQATPERALANPVLVGEHYVLKLDHNAHDKARARAGLGRYHAVVDQPVRGQRNRQGQTIDGGQRIGEMEAWALMAHNASALLQEIYTLKADSGEQRWRLYVGMGGVFGATDNILDLEATPLPTVWSILAAYLLGLGLQLSVTTRAGETKYLPQAQAELKPQDIVALQLERMDDNRLQAFSQGEVTTAYILNSARYKKDKDNYKKNKDRDKVPELETPNPETPEQPMGKFHPTGLESEQLFGPLRHYSCACGQHQYQKELANTRCKRCNTPLLNRTARRQRFAHITLAQAVPNPYIEHYGPQNGPQNGSQTQMISTLPVIPPLLRPARMDTKTKKKRSHPLTIKYQRVLRANHKIKRQKDDPSKNYQALVKAVRELMLGPGSLSDLLDGKTGLLNRYLLGKRVDYSGRAVIVPDPTLALDECRLPWRLLVRLFEPHLVAQLKQAGITEPQRVLRRAANGGQEEQTMLHPMLEALLPTQRVLLNRNPTLHRLGLLAFKPLLGEGDVIAIAPMVTAGFNADFDGDRMAVFLPVTPAALKECEQMLPSAHLWHPADGRLALSLAQDLALGHYIASGDDKTAQAEQLSQVATNQATTNQATQLHTSLAGFAETAFAKATASGLSFALSDLHALQQQVSQNVESCQQLATLRATAAEAGHICHASIESGARSDWAALLELINAPANLTQGLSNGDLLCAAAPERDNLVATKLMTANSGDVCKQLVAWARNISINQGDCQTTKSLAISAGDSNAEHLYLRLYGRVLAADLSTFNPQWQAGLAIDAEQAKQLADWLLADEQRTVSVRSPLYCEDSKGLCRTCYGLPWWRYGRAKLAWDMSDLVPLNTRVGLLAAQAMAEPTTQSALHSKHGQSESGVNDIRTSLRRADRAVRAACTKREKIPLDPILLGCAQELSTIYTNSGISLAEIHIETLVSSLHHRRQEQARWLLPVINAAASIESAGRRNAHQLLVAAALEQSIDPLSGLHECVTLGQPLPSVTDME